MNCASCGFELAVDDLFCLSCGCDTGYAGTHTVSPAVEAGRTSKSRSGSGGCSCGAQPSDVISGVCNVCGALCSLRDDLTVHLGKQRLAMRTHMGKRHWPNEDYAIVDFEIMGSKCYRWIIVSDGVSSAENAELASEVACHAASNSLRHSVENSTFGMDAVAQAIWAAQRSVLAIPFTDRKKEPPEATIAIALVDDEQATIGWVGDSRVYSIVRGRDGLTANLLTRDHSYANALVDSGKMSMEEAMQSPDSHCITQSLGILPAGEELELGLRQTSTKGALCFLACSDGLWNYVHPVATDAPSLLINAISPQLGDPHLMVSRLIDYANDCGGQDNVTAAAVMMNVQE